MLDLIGNPDVIGTLIGTLSIMLIRVLFLKIDDLEKIR